MSIDAACQVLGVDPGADPDEVRAAFRRRMDLADGCRQSPTRRLEGPNPRLVQVAVASTLAFGASVFVVFFLVAFSQSGR